MINRIPIPKMAVVLSCEHGGNGVPAEFRELFRNAPKVLESHRGWDPGALELFSEMAPKGVDYSLFSETTRLLIDLNRSLNRRSLFSEFTKPLSSEEKKQIIDCYYYPFRKQFLSKVSSLAGERNFILHISVHSFTPVLSGKKRNADVGLLYDPAFGAEKEIAILWKKMIERRIPQLRVRMNYPYLGKNDGHVFSLRNYLGSDFYAGIELEINQEFAFCRNFNKAFSDVFQDFLGRLK